MQKRGYFFSVDVLIATIILAFGVYLVFTMSSNRPYVIQTKSFSDDMLNVLGSTKVTEINNDVVQEMISSGKITNTENTLLEQAGEFYYLYTEDEDQAHLDDAYAMLEAVTSNMAPSQYGFYISVRESLAMDGTELYRKGSSDKTSRVLMSSKRVATGFASKNQMWGPYIMEVVVWQSPE